MSAPRKRRREGTNDTRDLLIEATGDILLEDATPQQPHAGSRPRPVSIQLSCTTTSPPWTNCSSRCSGEAPRPIWRDSARLSRPRHPCAHCGSGHRTPWGRAADGVHGVGESPKGDPHRDSGVRRAVPGESGCRAHRDPPQRGINLDALPPTLMSVMISSLGATLANESTLGITQGHKDLEEFAEDFVRVFEGHPWTRTLGISVVEDSA